MPVALPNPGFYAVSEVEFSACVPSEACPGTNGSVVSAMLNSQPEGTSFLTHVFDEFFTVTNSSTDENSSLLAVGSGASLRSALLVQVNVSGEQCAPGYGSSLCSKCNK